MAQRRSLRVIALVGVLLFWVGVFAAGAVVDGYSAREDYISSLASRGSPVAVLGVAALLANATAQFATSRALLIGWRSRTCAAFVFAAGLAMTGVAAFRASCPDGPAGCALDDGAASDWIDAVHGASVVGYELFTLAAMLTLTIGGFRKGSPLPRWLGLLSLAFAVGSVLLIGQTEGGDIGMWQRLWLANNLAWLLVVAWTTAGSTSATPPSSPTSAPRSSASRTSP